MGVKLPHESDAGLLICDWYSLDAWLDICSKTGSGVECELSERCDFFCVMYCCSVSGLAASTPTGDGWLTTERGVLGSGNTDCPPVLRTELPGLMYDVMPREGMLGGETESGACAGT